MRLLLADINMLIEGAYPYVSGGVSSWVHALLTNLPDFTFDITHIGVLASEQEHDDGKRRRKRGGKINVHRPMKYRLPENVVGFHDCFIDEKDHLERRRAVSMQPDAWNHFTRFHEAVAFDRPYAIGDFAPLLAGSGFAGLTARDIFHSRQSWEMLTAIYQQHAAEQSFVDFFWTFRLTYWRLFALLEATVPPAPIYHAVSTGFAGFLGALAKLRNGGSLIVTEHGIYTREREIEIMQSEWIYQSRSHDYRLKERLGFFQTWWLNVFRFMERLTYECADAVVSINRVNQDYQMNPRRLPGRSPDGPVPGATSAHSEKMQQKMHLIPNGVNTERLATLPRKEIGGDDPFTVGFVGRVVSIKDVKTFIRAVKIAAGQIPNLRARIVGPTDEEQDYFQECRRLVEMLDLTSIVHFDGPRDVIEVYPQLDVLVLTSLSEGQPLVILEGNGAGLPVVATDVGGCRELLEGASAEDQVLGYSGIITPVSSPDMTAAALVQLWRDPALRQNMGEIGRERVQRFYRQDDLYAAYRALYQSYLAPVGA